MLERLTWRIRALVGDLLTGPGVWGWVRLAGAVLAVFAFAGLSRHFWSEPGAPPAMYFTRWGLRYLVWPVFAIVGAFLVGAGYVRQLYHLPAQRLGIRYLFPAIFGIRYPTLKIVDGRRNLHVGELNLVDQVGGPGYLDIQPGSAVVLESLTRPTNVYGAGLHFVTRLERIREVISLAEQQDKIASLRINTLDGIPVTVQDIQYRYRLRGGRRPGQAEPQSAGNPYPILNSAAREMAYRRNSNAAGVLPWAQMVRNGAEGAIQGYVRPARLDEIATPAPDRPDPRAEISRQAQQATARSIRGNGAELVWMDIGHLEPLPDDVRERQAAAWGEPWKGQATLNRAEADAERLRLQELGRAEAQAEMLVNLVGALGALDLSGNPRENLRNLIILRTAQILEAMAERQQPVYRDYDGLLHQQTHPLGGGDGAGSRS